MNALDHSSEFKVKAPSAKPLLKKKAASVSVAVDFPSQFVAVMNEHSHLKGRLHVLALNGWPESDVDIWRKHFVNAAFLSFGRDITKALTIELPALDVLKAYVTAFYAAKVTT